MYTIGQIAKMTDFTADTLRYYDRMGLLPFVKKDSRGIRYFSEQDLDKLATIQFMKETGASIKEIKDMVELIVMGDASINERLDHYLSYKVKLEEQMKEIQANIEKVDWKIDYYSKAAAAGTEAIHRDEPGLFELYYKEKPNGEDKA